MLEMPEREPARQSPAELEEEARKLRRLQLMMNMVMSVLAQDPDLSLEQAREMIDNTKRAALALFPGKGSAFDLIYAPRLRRVVRERFRIS